MTVPVVGQRVSTLAVRRWHLSMVNLCGVGFVIIPHSTMRPWSSYSMSRPRVVEIEFGHTDGIRQLRLSDPAHRLPAGATRHGSDAPSHRQC
ncbi:hypothetical protein PFI50_19305 [Mycobacterium xenopi]|uniref:hypothetical protein n=1 Tax=Mycobacterium xenopi TaxID=1789 RepID=UPI001FD14BDD|nr:hypothetical protein [Mycobacterium xenopi]MDA3641517.1 hypothetical protein [Mycobacterium xenopi]MDA3659363.1 hypothetical protein [Mycobacterium xenopi]